MMPPIANPSYLVVSQTMVSMDCGSVAVSMARIMGRKQIGFIGTSFPIAYQLYLSLRASSIEMRANPFGFARISYGYLRKVNRVLQMQGARGSWCEPY